ncbi:MAG: peptidase T [Chitinophagaceae bacterium]|nr:peptidase T [Chitinophagaceae bacterium]
MSSLVNRFIRYVQMDTQSDPHANTFPSTPKQKNLSHLLATELLAMGVEDAHTDEFGYVYATIPANTNKNVPVICFCSHIDTAPDCSGTNVKPILHRNYNGLPLVLPDDPTQVITMEAYPYLHNHLGKDIITASGKTLLGADDKAGVTIIMEMVKWLQENPSVKHGMIKVLFTPDEEVGNGTAKLDLQKLGANYGYTLDGGSLGSFEDETFSADGLTITIEGVIAHPGYAKDKMINALKIAGQILAALPKDRLAPEVTDQKQGFIHPIRVEGLAEKAIIDFIIRDFDTAQLAHYEMLLKDITETVIKKYPGATYNITVVEQYRNMKEVLIQHPLVEANAKEAYNRVGIPFIKEPIRGGTDGSRLSFMGLPCPNIFTGMQAIHSKHEWVGVSDMEAAVKVLTELVQVWEQNTTN